MTKPLTREQRVALLSVYHRDWGTYEKPSYLAWRRSGHNCPMVGCFVIPWVAGMWLGIETDGYTHS